MNESHLGTATYSPEDNKLRLYPFARLSKEDYNQVKSHGFAWAPKQECFYAQWTPLREDLMEKLCGEIEDEDKSLVQRAEERAERFIGYKANRERDAASAERSIEFAKDIPLGQPILVGHHSEKRARKDAERIEQGVRKAIRMWETADYWKSRAQGALANAKYKELPAVRYRRMQGLESEKRKHEKYLAQSEKALELWNTPGLTLEMARKLANGLEYSFNILGLDGTNYYSVWDCLRPDEERYKNCPSLTVEEAVERARRIYPKSQETHRRWIAHLQHRLQYERAMLDESGGLKAEAFEIEPGGQVLSRAEWSTVLRVNRKNGQITSARTTAKYCSLVRIEDIKDYRPPSEESRLKVKKATTLPPMCNYPGEGFVEMTKAEWERVYSDCRGSEVIVSDSVGKHRVRREYGSMKKKLIFITDMPRKDPPPASQEAEEPIKFVNEREDRTFHSVQEESNRAEQLREHLKQGINVAVVDQLFPTPPEIAASMADYADIQAGHVVLEPSAGAGNLVKAIQDLGLRDVEIHAVEINERLLANLKELTEFVLPADFLGLVAGSNRYDRIVMNPPFKNGEDIKHIQHAMTFLKPGGRLVALCANGPRQQNQLKPKADMWIDLPDGSFRESGTNVNVAMLIYSRSE